MDDDDIIDLTGDTIPAFKKVLPPAGQASKPLPTVSATASTPTATAGAKRVFAPIFTRIGSGNSPSDSAKRLCTREPVVVDEVEVAVSAPPPLLHPAPPCLSPVALALGQLLDAKMAAQEAGDLTKQDKLTTELCNKLKELLTCPICMDSYSPSSSTPGGMFTPMCGHHFHQSCITKTLSRGAKTCPVCNRAMTAADIHPIFI